MRNRRRLLTLSSFGVVVVGLMSIDLSHCQERQQQKGSKLGGYEKPPAANDVPDHRWDIILGRPTDHSVTVRVLAYEDLDGHARLGNIRSAVEYGYLNGEVQSSSGHIRVNVSSDSVRVDYVRSYLPSHESSQRKNGDVSYSYLIRNDQ